MIGDWVQVAFNVLGPIAVGGVIWLYAQIYSLKTDYALSKQNLAALQVTVDSESDLPGRVIKLETSFPYMVASTEELKKMVNSVQASVQRIEVSIAKNTPTGHE